MLHEVLDAHVQCHAGFRATRARTWSAGALQNTLDLSRLCKRTKPAYHAEVQNAAGMIETLKQDVTTILRQKFDREGLHKASELSHKKRGPVGQKVSLALPAQRERGPVVRHGDTPQGCGLRLDALRIQGQRGLTADSETGIRIDKEIRRQPPVSVERPPAVP